VNRSPNLAVLSETPCILSSAQNAKRSSGPKFFPENERPTTLNIFLYNRNNQTPHALSCKLDWLKLISLFQHISVVELLAMAIDS
jgi:hypothetical protein